MMINGELKHLKQLTGNLLFAYWLHGPLSFYAHSRELKQAERFDIKIILKLQYVLGCLCYSRFALHHCFCLDCTIFDFAWISQWTLSFLYTSF